MNCVVLTVTYGQVLRNSKRQRHAAVWKIDFSDRWEKMNADFASNLTAFFARIIERHDVPSVPLTAVIFVMVGALLYNQRIWVKLKYPVTLVHEAGHGFVGMLFGRKLHGIRLHSDTSGLTVTAGSKRGLGVIFTTLWGYPAPSVLGGALLLLVAQGYATLALWLLVLMLVLVLLQIRNFFGLWSVLASGLVVVAGAQYLDPFFQSLLATAFAALLLVGSVRAVRNLQVARKQEVALSGSSASDADSLREHTLIPASLWVGFFYLFTGGMLAATLGWLFWAASSR